MAVTPNSIVTPQGPYSVIASLAAVTACTTRAPTATASLAAANISAFVPVSTNGCKIDFVQIKGCSSAFASATVAQSVMIWQHDGTTAWIIKEVIVAPITPSTIVASYDSGPIALGVVLPAAHSLYISTSITTLATTTALQIAGYGSLL